MKKFLFTLFITILMITNMNTAKAESPIKNYCGYTVLNHKLEEVIPCFDKAIRKEAEIVKLKDAPNTYYATYEDAHSYIRLYPANNNTDVYIVSDMDYDRNSNDMTYFFNYHNLKFVPLENKEALQEYKYDFIDYARTGNLDGLFIMPDFVKPLKIGMGKINDKISKKSKKTAAVAYDPNDKEPIDLTCVQTMSYKNESAQINVNIKEYRLKNKQNKYVHAFEYILTNTANTPVTLNKVTSERVASLKDVTSQTFVDLDKLDILDTVGSLPPVIICTCGLSLGFTAANTIRLGQVTKESLRYSHSLPENQDIVANGSLRILVLKFKNDPKPLNFFVTRNGQKYEFSY